MWFYQLQRFIGTCECEWTINASQSVWTWIIEHSVSRVFWRCHAANRLARNITPHLRKSSTMNQRLVKASVVSLLFLTFGFFLSPYAHTLHTCLTPQNGLLTSVNITFYKAGNLWATWPVGDHTLKAVNYPNILPFTVHHLWTSLISQIMASTDSNRKNKSLNWKFPLILGASTITRWDGCAAFSREYILFISCTK